MKQIILAVLMLVGSASAAAQTLEPHRTVRIATDDFTYRHQPPTPGFGQILMRDKTFQFRSAGSHFLTAEVGPVTAQEMGYVTFYLYDPRGNEICSHVTSVRPGGSDTAFQRCLLREAGNYALKISTTEGMKTRARAFDLRLTPSAPPAATKVVINQAYSSTFDTSTPRMGPYQNRYHLYRVSVSAGTEINLFLAGGGIPIDIFGPDGKKRKVQEETFKDDDRGYFVADQSGEYWLALHTMLYQDKPEPYTLRVLDRATAGSLRAANREKERQRAEAAKARYEAAMRNAPKPQLLPVVPARRATGFEVKTVAGGVQITQMDPGASGSSSLKVGSIITKIGGKPVSTAEDFRAEIERLTQQGRHTSVLTGNMHVPLILKK